eukprot:gene21401-25716_t
MAWVLLIVSYGSYWYKTHIEGLGGGTIDIYVKHDQIKTVKKFNGDSRTSTESWSESNNTASIYKASLAFAIIAWIIVTVTLVFIAMSMFGILSKIPLPLGLVTKFLPIAAFVCCILSMFIFLGVGSARKKDCEKNTIGVSCDDVKQYKKFVGKEGDSYSWGPYASWATTVVSAAAVASESPFTYWYKSTAEFSVSKSTSYTKHDGIKTTTESGADKSTDFNSWSKIDRYTKNQQSIYKASEAFAILAWIIVTVTLVMIAMSLFGVLSKIPLPLGMVVKFLPIVGFVFCILSMFIFLGLPSAMKKDCEEKATIKGLCDIKQYKKLTGSEEAMGVKDSWGPNAGFATVVIASVIKSTRDGDTNTSDWGDNHENALNIFKASLSLAIIAWIIVSVALLCVILSLFGILSKIPFIGGITKFLPIFAFICSLVSFLVFIGLPNGFMKDCSDLLSKDVCKDVPQYKKLIGSKDNDTIKWGPSISWATTIVAAALTLGASVVSFLAGQF